MAVLISLLSNGIQAGILYAMFLTVWISVLSARHTTRKVLYSLPSLPVFLLLLLACFFWLTRPSTIFKDSFGFAPSSDVTGLQSSSWLIGSSRTYYLHFKATPAMVQRITSKGMLPFGPDTDEPKPEAYTCPNWWPSPNDSVQKFTGRVCSRGFVSEEDYLVYDPATGDVWYRFRGID